MQFPLGLGPIQFGEGNMKKRQNVQRREGEKPTLISPGLMRCPFSALKTKGGHDLGGREIILRSFFGKFNSNCRNWSPETRKLLHQAQGRCRRNKLFTSFPATSSVFANIILTSTDLRPLDINRMLVTFAAGLNTRSSPGRGH